ncbi:hypothetical protein H8959_006679 [Pygathrix nigripes]
MSPEGSRGSEREEVAGQSIPNGSFQTHRNVPVMGLTSHGGRHQEYFYTSKVIELLIKVASDPCQLLWPKVETFSALYKQTFLLHLSSGCYVNLGEAVFARCLSSLKDERIQASKKLKGPQKFQFDGDKKSFLEDIRKALYASKIISYAQGFMLLRQAAIEFGWTLNYGGIALMWRGGCIIRRHEMLPANLIQAQRDYFGAHTYELLAKPGQFIHTNWTGHGGSVSSSSYNA